MAAKVRKQFRMDAEQDAELRALAARLGVTQSELVRRLLAQGLAAARRSLEREEAWAREVRFIESRMAQGPAEGGRRWRREELHER